VEGEIMHAGLDAAAVDDTGICDLDGAADARTDVKIPRRVGACTLDAGHDLPAASTVSVPLPPAET
jgi:hypothetical protein